MSYAKIANVNSGVAPTLDPSKARAGEKSHLTYGLAGLMKPLVQTLPGAANSTTLYLDLPEEESPDLYETNSTPSPVMKVYITTNGHPNLRGHIIRQLISQQQIHLLNYGRADTWFFSSDNFNVTTMNNTTK